jgi:opacity protein-like surface antigen
MIPGILKRARITIVSIVTVMGGVACAHAARADGLSGVYVGGSFGWAQNEYDPAYINDLYISSAKDAGDALKYRSTSVHKADDAWWANAGYMAWPYLGIDASFIHLGEWTYRGTGSVQTSDGRLPVITTGTVTSHGPALALLARLPLADSLDADIRVGDYYGKTTLVSGLDFNSKYTTTVQSTSKSSLLLSAGAVYTFVGHWSVRLDYLRVNQAGGGQTGKYDVNVAAAGVAFTF